MKLAGHPATEAKHMNNWLNRLERKYGRYGIPNLTNILVAGQILVLAIELFVDRTITGWLGLNRFLLLQGQIWRVISFIFIPFSGGSTACRVEVVGGDAAGGKAGTKPGFAHQQHAVGQPPGGQHLLHADFQFCVAFHAVQHHDGGTPFVRR